MTSTILQNPYAAILRAIWSIIIEVAQVAANNLGKVRTYHTIPNHEYTIPDSGAANPLELLHPDCGGSVAMETPPSNEFYPLQEPELLALRKAGVIGNVGYVYLALRLENADDTYVDVEAFVKKWDIPKSSVYEAISKINQLNIAFTVKVRTPNRIEELIRDRLQDDLGGFTEVVTPSGRIDVLTKTQIIEVKAFKEWKAALGQILVYSAFYPKHEKRIHLFGTAAELAKLADIQAACLGFDALVTGEEVTSEPS